MRRRQNRSIYPEYTNVVDVRPSEDKQPRLISSWEKIALVITAGSALFAVISQWQENPIAASLLAGAAIVLALWSLTPWSVSRLKEWHLNRTRNQVASNHWGTLKEHVKHFGTFAATDHSETILKLTQEISQRAKRNNLDLYPPNYLPDWFSKLRDRLAATDEPDEIEFNLIVREFLAQVTSFNRYYVRNPFEIIRRERVLGSLQGHDPEHYGRKLESFREHWMFFLNDLAKWVRAINSEMIYDPYSEAFSDYFETPEPL